MPGRQLTFSLSMPTNSSPRPSGARRGDCWKKLARGSFPVTTGTLVYVSIPKRSLRTPTQTGNAGVPRSCSPCLKNMSHLQPVPQSVYELPANGHADRQDSELQCVKASGLLALRRLSVSSESITRCHKSHGRTRGLHESQKSTRS